ncbi:hypothetical protein MMC10_006335 [Thelotrema lepadinum]|nr:hypothetical protein [Thelotrema lepadinum]
MTPKERNIDVLSDHEDTKTRRRSRSPRRHTDHLRSRQEDPGRTRHERHRQERSHSAKEPPPPLPYDAKTLSKHDYRASQPLFEYYLEIQKNLKLIDLDESEARGRWKSFIGKWNRGELAQGWYSPSTLKNSTSSSQQQTQSAPQTIGPKAEKDGRVESDDDEPGPLLPGELLRQHGRSSKVGPAIPSMQDLELKRERAQEDANDSRSYLHKERRAQNTLEKQRLKDLVPKAEAGTKERQLEKKKEVASANKAFAVAKEGGDMPDIADKDLLGGDEDDLASFKKRKTEVDRQKSERELRREEISRAKREEREQRQREFRAREEKTMQGFVELAKRRFG